MQPGRVGSILVSVLMMSASFLQAQDSGLTSLETRDAGRGWEAVGRIDIADKGFCTGTLIREDLVLTAAHCLFDADGNPIAPERFQFLAGFRDGRAEAYRGVRRALPHPDYIYRATGTNPADVAKDIALLELDQPIRNTRIIPIPVAPEPNEGDSVGVVSYGKERSEAPSLQDVCEVEVKQEGIIVMSCDVDFGSSGSPVFRMQENGNSIVSVVSAMADYEGHKVSLGTSLSEPLADLLALLDQHGLIRPVGNARVISPGQRNDTGAKFVSPGG
jgi:protease YdgD